MYNRFHEGNFRDTCDTLAAIDEDLGTVIKTYGYPPLWTRPPKFSTLILTILEQQVSLASAYAAFSKLKQKLRYITPERLLQLTDEDLRACYFSRQKILYAKELAKAIVEKDLVLKNFPMQSDEEVRESLKRIKGIGDWTADIYLIHALQRTDIFPIGDLALVNAMKEVKKLPKETSKEELIDLSVPWQPHRSVATMILWHHYIKKRNIRI